MKLMHEEYIEKLSAMKCWVDDLEMNLNTLTQPELEIDIESDKEEPPKVNHTDSYISYGFSDDGVSRSKA